MTSFVSPGRLGFVGFRGDVDLGPVDLPLGLRVDVRPGNRDLPTSVMVGLSIDAIAVGIAVYGFYGLIDKAGRH